jgi:hypothetical protein
MTDVLRLFGPLLLWLASFSAIYGLQGVLCAQGWDRAFLLPVWMLAVALQVATLVVLSTERFGADAGFVRWVSLALATVSLVAVIWTLAPIAFLSACV